MAPPIWLRRRPRRRRPSPPSANPTRPMPTLCRCRRCARGRRDRLRACGPGRRRRRCGSRRSPGRAWRCGRPVQDALSNLQQLKPIWRWRRAASRPLRPNWPRPSPRSMSRGRSGCRQRGAGRATADRDAIPPSAAATAAAQAAVVVADAAVSPRWPSHGIEMDGDNVFIKNIAADLGDTASFNGFMTIFGQFFDHGLDLTTKGGAGSVYIPLHPDDPLYVPGSSDQFHGADPCHERRPAPTASSARPTTSASHTNETTPWIDLNQVYTSNPSHQVFLREYVAGRRQAGRHRSHAGKRDGGPADLGRHQGAGAATCSASS